MVSASGGTLGLDVTRCGSLPYKMKTRPRTTTKTEITNNKLTWIAEHCKKDGKPLHAFNSQGITSNDRRQSVIWKNHGMYVSLLIVCISGNWQQFESRYFFIIFLWSILTVLYLYIKCTEIYHTHLSLARAWIRPHVTKQESIFHHALYLYFFWIVLLLLKNFDDSTNLCNHA